MGMPRAVFLRWFGFAALLGGLMVLPRPALADARHDSPKPAPKPAPALVVDLLDGQRFDLSAQRGHVVVLHLWASWCPPCRAEMPLLDHVARTHQGVSVVGLSFDKPRDLDAVRRAMAGLSFPTALASRAKTNGFGTPGTLPQTLVIDREGRIVAWFESGRAMMDEAGLAEALASAEAPARLTL